MFDKSSIDDDNKRAPIQIEDSSVSNDSNDVMIKEERNNSLANAMSLIKREEHRQILTLFYLEEKSYKEISEEMKVSLSMVKTLLYRAKNSLKAILDKKGFKL
jgi:RNA polymerase sigma-70 factor (ECF subfamily)